MAEREHAIQSAPEQAIQPVPLNAVALVLHPRELHMYSISEPELDSIGTATQTTSLETGLLGIAAGAFIAFGIVLFTVDISKPMVFASFVGLTAVSFFFTLFFGFRTLAAWRAMKGVVNQVKGQ